MTMLRLSRADAVMANGTLCAVARIDPQFVELHPLDGEDAPISLSHPELLGLLAEGRFSVEYGYFSSRQASAGRLELDAQIAMPDEAPRAPSPEELIGITLLPSPLAE